MRAQRSLGRLRGRRGKRGEPGSPSRPWRRRNYAVFKEYTSEIEQLLEGFLEAEASTPEELVGACRAAYESGEASGFSCVDYLLASAEYEHFMNMMYDFAAMQHGWEEEGEEKEGAAVGGLETARDEAKAEGVGK